MALTTIANVKTFLGLSGTTYDTVLTMIVAGTDLAISNYCDRTFEINDFIENVNALDNRIILKNRPIDTIYYAGYGTENAIEVKYTGTGLASVQIETTRVRLFENLVATEYLYSSYATLSTLATAMNGKANFTVTLSEEGLSKTLWEASMSLENDETVYLQKPGSHACLTQIYDGFYVSDCQNNHKLIYRGGYSTIPADLVLIATKIASSVFQQRQTAGTLKSESIGDYSYTIADSTADADTVISSSFGQALKVYRNAVL
jgi:hypothetical protein